MVVLVRELYRNLISQDWDVLNQCHPHRNGTFGQWDMGTQARGVTFQFCCPLSCTGLVLEI